MLVIIIIFLAVSFLMAGILAMGAIPKIFQSADKINQTQELVNQTQIQLHEDEARQNQTDHEDRARFMQAQQIRNDIRQLLEEHDNRTKNYIQRENNTTQRILQNQEIVMAQHQKVGIDHNKIQDLVKNITLENNQMLKKFGSENNAMLRGILKALNLNATQLIEDYYKNQTTSNNNNNNNKIK